MQGKKDSVRHEFALSIHGKEKYIGTVCMQLAEKNKNYHCAAEIMVNLSSSLELKIDEMWFIHKMD